MLKKINQILKLVGFNLVHAKKAKARNANRHTVKSGDPYATTSVPSDDYCVNEYNAGTEGRTHYVGDSCAGGHVDASPTQDNKVSGPTS